MGDDRVETEELIGPSAYLSPNACPEGLVERAPRSKLAEVKLVPTLCPPHPQLYVVGQ